MSEEFNPYCLKDKTILVTGASSGIGKQVAINISKIGGSVVICGRNKERLDETFSLLSGSNNFSFVGDLTDNDYLNNLVTEIPSLNGIVFCAGILAPYPIKFIEQKQIDEIFNINFNSIVLLTSKLLKKKKLIHGGSAVFISSISATYTPYYGGALYAASKAAIESFSRTMALENAKSKIRSNCISPAVVKTSLFDESLKYVASYENFERHEDKYPLGYGDPNDIANTAIFLLSDASKWITGTTLTLDGGFLTSPA